MPTVPLSRLLPAWLLLAAGMAGAFAVLAASLDPTARLAGFAAAWMISTKAATLICLAPDDRKRLGWPRFLAYLICPVMQPRQFLPERKPSASDIRPTVRGVLINLAAGLVFLRAIPALMPEGTPLVLRFWSGLVGAVLLTLFMRFDIAILIFRAFGIAVEKCWYNPIASVTLAEFWGLRWNRIMSGVMREVIFLPLARRIGATLALAAVFLYSGVFHEFVSFAAGGGYGWPTLYFLIQGAGVWLEGRGGFRRVLLRRRWLGRLWTFAVVLLPVTLVCHRPVVDRVLVPMLRDLGVPGLPS